MNEMSQFKLQKSKALVATTLQNWLDYGPEISKLLKKFENFNESMSQVRVHHNFSESVQTNFHKYVKSLLSGL